MNKNLHNCKSCGQELAKSAKTCPHCGAKNTKPFFTKWWFWLIFICIVVTITANGNDNTTSINTHSSPDQTTQHNVLSPNEKTSVFSGDCGISAVAEMGIDIIGQPTVSVSITNTSDKDISAIKFYALPFDVYGEELKGIFTTNYLSTDNTITAGNSKSIFWQFLDNNVKTVKLYIYSVYFSDGSEWGDREATKSVILQNAPEITVHGKSEK